MEEEKKLDNNANNYNNNIENSNSPSNELEIEKIFGFSLFYIILFIAVFITNLIYFNAPNYKLENFIEESDSLNFNNSFYKVTSRYVDKNSKRIF